MIVLDASAAVDLLLDLVPGAWVREAVEEDPEVATVHLLDVEVLSAMRRMVHGGVVAEDEARAAIESLRALPVERFPHHGLGSRIWALRASLTAYDAAYVALAEALGATLVTTDAALARSPGLVVDVRCWPGGA